MRDDDDIDELELMAIERMAKLKKENPKLYRAKLKARDRLVAWYCKVFNIGNPGDEG